jgi:hypothetical protein
LEKPFVSRVKWRVIAVSSGLVVQALINVPLSAAFLSNGLFVLLLLWRSRRIRWLTAKVGSGQCPLRCRESSEWSWRSFPKAPAGIALEHRILI